MKKIILSLILLLIVGSAFSQKVNSDTISQRIIVVKIKDSIVYYEGILSMKDQRTSSTSIRFAVDGSMFSSSELLELFRMSPMRIGEPVVSSGEGGILLFKLPVSIEEKNKIVIVVIEFREGGLHFMKLPSSINIYIKEIKININDLK